MSISATTLPRMKLIYAKAVDIYPYVDGTGFDYLYGYIEVATLTSSRQVSVHYSYKMSKSPWNEWKESSANQISSVKDGFDYWYFRTPNIELYSPRGTVEFQFAIKYVIGEQIYWDNNNNNNYNVGVGENPHYPSLILVHGLIALNKAIANLIATSGLSFSGSVVVKASVYKKFVKIVYTTDDWHTVNEVFCRYEKPIPYGTDTEVWTFSTVIDSNTSQIKFAIACSMNDTTIWDNNFGANYLLQVPGKIE